MVRGHGDQRPLELSALPQRGQEAPELGVDEGQLAVVGRVGEAAPVGLRRGVVRVRIEVVHPQEPAPRAALLEPAQGALGGVVGARLADEEHRRRPTAVQVVVVVVEALVEAEALVEHEGRDDRAGLEARPRQVLAQGGDLAPGGSACRCCGRRAGTGAGGQDRRVGRQGHRADRDALLEQTAGPGQPVEGSASRPARGRSTRRRSARVVSRVTSSRFSIGSPPPEAPQADARASSTPPAASRPAPRARRGHA